MQFGDLANDAEAQATATRTAGFIRAVEAVEEAREIHRGHARPVVLDFQRDAPGDMGGPN